MTYIADIAVVLGYVFARQLLGNAATSEVEP